MNPRDPVAEALLARMQGCQARGWEVRNRAPLEAFLARGGRDVLAQAGLLLSTTADGVLLEWAPHPDPWTPAKEFLRHYRATGRSEDYVSKRDAQGHWYAEHVGKKWLQAAELLDLLHRDKPIPALPRKDPEPVRLLVELGGREGRIRGVEGGVIRGVARLEPMSLTELAAELGAELEEVHP